MMLMPQRAACGRPTAQQTSCAPALEVSAQLISTQTKSPVVETLREHTGCLRLHKQKYGNVLAGCRGPEFRGLEVRALHTWQTCFTLNAARLNSALCCIQRIKRSVMSNLLMVGQICHI